MPSRLTAQLGFHAGGAGQAEGALWAASAVAKPANLDLAPLRRLLDRETLIGAPYESRVLTKWGREWGRGARSSSTP
jgi:hypothetical protein